MDSTPLLPNPELLQLERITEDAQAIILTFSTVRPAVACPNCGHFTHHVHSRYVRQIADLPLHGQRVCFVVTCRKFFCANGSCPRRIFTERLPELAPPYARRTLRLHRALHFIGLVLGGRAGALLAQNLGMHTARDTILRGLKRWVRSLGAEKATEKAPVRAVGIDDWAFRKGLCYGTILCDLTNHTVLDLLPERSVESAAAWLSQHPEIEILSRDRGGIYVEAGRLGAPQAVQVADRFHLLKNLVEMMQRVVSNEQPQVQELFREPSYVSTHEPSQLPFGKDAGNAADEISQASPDSRIEIPSNDNTPKLTRTQKLKAERLQKKQECYELVKNLRKTGLTLREVAERVGLSRRTVQRMVNAQAFPYASTRTKRSKTIDRYRRYLDERWESGCHNATQLFREIQAQGFRGSYGTLYACLCEESIVQAKKQARKASRASPQLVAVPSPRQLSWLLLYPEKALAIAERREGSKASQRLAAALDQLLASDSPLKTATILARQFVGMVSQRQPEELDGWIQAMMEHGMEELRRFAQGILQDYAAIRAALELDVSNGQVEGQVNRLKTIKRQMYGRAGLELLKARVIATP